MGCGGDDSSGSGGSGEGENSDKSDLSADEEQWVDDALVGFESEDEDLSEDQARCIAGAVVGELGLDRLDELGITPESFNDSDEALPDLKDAEAEAIVDGIEECLDLRQLMLDGFTEGEDYEQETIDCLEDNIDDAAAHDLMVASIRGDETAGIYNDIFEAIGDCPGLESLN